MEIPTDVSADPAVLEAYLGDDFVLEADDERSSSMIELTNVHAGYGGGDVLQGVDLMWTAPPSPASSAPTVPGSRRCCAP